MELINERKLSWIKDNQTRIRYRICIPCEVRYKALPFSNNSLFLTWKRRRGKQWWLVREEDRVIVKAFNKFSLLREDMVPWEDWLMIHQKVLFTCLEKFTLYIVNNYATTTFKCGYWTYKLILQRKKTSLREFKQCLRSLSPFSKLEDWGWGNLRITTGENNF